MNAELIKALTAEPHLAPYLDDGDRDLEPARQRWNAMQGRVQKALTRAGAPIRVRQTSHGLTTTALTSDRDRAVEEPRP